MLPDDVQNYLVARAAEWAGDLEHARDLYATFSLRQNYPLFPEKFETPLDVIRFVSTLRAGRLGEPLAKETLALSRRVFVEPPAFGKAIPKPLPLRNTKHIRGVVHRIDTRDFEMRAYLLDLEYSRQLYQIAEQMGQLRGDANNTPSSEKSYYRGAGGGWVVEGPLFQKVFVTDFGLIKSEGRWTKRELPRSSEEILASFQRILDELDPTGISAS